MTELEHQVVSSLAFRNGWPMRPARVARSLRVGRLEARRAIASLHRAKRLHRRPDGAYTPLSRHWIHGVRLA